MRILAGQTQAEAVEFGTAPGEPGTTRRLPIVTIDDLIGLLEYLGEAPPPQATDIYRVAEDLKLDSDQLLRASEAAELLGFAQVAQGDIALTPLGETFADASILARKEIFATRLRRLPIFAWLLHLLRATAEHRLEYDVAITALELEFPPLEAERQLDVLINWGRYAELLSYDAASGMIYLEPGRGEER